MTKKSEIKKIKIDQKVAKKKDEKESLKNDSEGPTIAKKIKKPSHPITKIRIRENFESFYSGGEIQLLQENQLIFSIYEDKIRIYSLENYKTVSEIEHKDEEISNFIVFEKNKNKFLISFTRNGMVRLLKLIKNAQESFEYEVIEKKKLVNFLAVEMKIDMSGRYVVIADPKGDFKILNAQNLKVVREFNLGRGYVKMRIVGQYIIFISRDRTVVFYNILTDKKSKEIKSTNEVTFSDFAVLSANKKQIILTGFDNVIYYYDTQIDKIEPLFQVGSFITLVETISLADNSNLTLCVFGYENGSVEFAWFDLAKKTLERIEMDAVFKNKHQIQKILFDFQKSMIYFVTDEGEIFKTSLKSDKKQIKLEMVEEYVGLNDQIMDVKFINKNLGVVCTNSETIRIIDFESRCSKILSGHEDLVTSVDVYNEKYMITGSKDGKIYFWKIISKDAEEEDTQNSNLVFDKNSPGKFQVNFKLIKKYNGHSGSITTLKFGSKTGTKFVSAGSEGMIKLWDLKNKTCKSVKPHLKELNFVRISPNEKIIMTGSHDRHINFYHSKDLTLITQISAHKRGVWDGDFSPVEKIVATASSDQTIKLWNYEDLSKIDQVGTLEGSNAPVLKLKWIMRGLQIISGSSDGIIKVWNIKKCVCISSFDMHKGRIWSLDVFENFEDPTLIFSGDNNNGLILWEDCSLEENAANLIQIQENITMLEQLKILDEQKNFDEALILSFDKNMMVTFFETIMKWRAHFFNSSQLIYSFEGFQEQTNPKNEETFENLISPAILQIYKKDKKGLFLMLKNFMTHSKFIFLVQTILKILLNHQKMSELQTLQDELKESNLDLQQLFEIYKVFTERYFNSIKRNLKVACSFNLSFEEYAEKHE